MPQGRLINASMYVYLWQGGPGGSSLFGLFVEHGPFAVLESLELVPRNQTWNRHYGMLYIDNPVGAGFSYTETDSGYCTDSKECVARNLFVALQQFYQRSCAPPLPMLLNANFFTSFPVVDDSNSFTICVYFFFLPLSLCFRSLPRGAQSTSLRDWRILWRPLCSVYIILHPRGKHWPQAMPYCSSGRPLRSLAFSGPCR